MSFLNTNFVEEMERMFGSDEALGVYFVFTDDDSILTLSQFSSLNSLLGEDMPETISLLPHGGSAVCCTDYATLIYLSLPGRVQIFGFANDHNPTSRVSREKIHPGGHDFAIVDGRYIVDPWPRLVPCAFHQMVFDLEGDDAEIALDIYGSRSCWRHMIESEKYAIEKQVVHFFDSSPAGLHN
jgi:hypothetical protein